MMYTDENRGTIQNEPRMKQVIDFSGLKYGTMTPTDIDGFFEFGKKLFVYYEFKYGFASIPKGQYAALLRQVDTDRAAGKEAVLIFCRHKVKNTNSFVKAADCIVVKYYYNGQWWQGNGRTAKEITDKFYNKFILEKD